jgi:hypothetical protein
MNPGVLAGGSGLSQALSAHIERDKLAISIVTLACAGDCADVVAVATGGNAPYAFTWDDGSTRPERRVCPTSNTTYSVSVTDTGFASAEFNSAAQTVVAPLTAEVLQCPDAGAANRGPAACDDAARSFAASGAGANPQGPWSYGWSAHLGSTFTLFSTYYPFTPASLGAFNGIGYPDAAQWFDKANGYVDAATYYSVPPVPEVEFNPTAAASHPTQGNLAGSNWTLAPNQLALVPGTSTYAIARWTAAASGSYRLKTRFEGICGDNNLPTTTADVHVQHNGVDIAAGSIDSNGAGYTFSFANSVSVAAGDTIDFVVGSAGGIFICPDVTALAVELCASEPVK